MSLTESDSAAVFAALNRAAHLVLDPAPHVFAEDMAIRLANVPSILRRSGFTVPDDGL